MRDAVGTPFSEDGSLPVGLPSIAGTSHNCRGKRIDFDKMAAFDALPPCVRRALSAAPYSYNPRQVAAAIIRSGLTAERYASERMPAVIARDLARREAK